MARWLVEIEGDAFDVDAYPFWFPDGDAYAIREAGKVYCTGPGLDRCDPSDPLATRSAAVQRAAELAVQDWFCAAALLQPNLRPPTLGTVWREEDDGTRRGFANMASNMVGRGTLRVSARASLAASEGPTQAQQFLAAARSSSHLHTAMQLVARPGTTWPQLHRALEDIESHLGGPVSSKLPGVSDNLRERFTRSANTEPAGLDARHASGKFLPPPKPITLEEARDFVARTLEQTLRMELLCRRG